MIDILGYIGMLVVLTSFGFKNITTMRIINTIGCLITVVYASMIMAIPVLILNIGIVTINSIMLIISNKRRSK